MLGLASPTLEIQFLIYRVIHDWLNKCVYNVKQKATKEMKLNDHTCFEGVTLRGCSWYFLPQNSLRSQS